MIVHIRLLLQDQLLNEEERAVLYELDQSFIQEDSDEDQGPGSQLKACLACCEVYCCRDKGVLSLIAMFFVCVIGVVLLVLVWQLELPSGVGELARYVLSAGVFGLASGGTNWIAVVGLFYRIPGLIGSG